MSSTAPSPARIEPEPAGRRTLALLALAVVLMLLNAAGYAFHWFRRIGPYDEAVHALTSFGIVLTLLGRGFRLPVSLGRRPALVALLAIGCGLSLGLAWEYIEWATGLIGNRGDTLSDLALDGIGAAAAAIAWTARQPQPSDD